MNAVSEGSRRQPVPRNVTAGASLYFDHGPAVDDRIRRKMKADRTRWIEVNSVGRLAEHDRVGGIVHIRKGVHHRKPAQRIESDTRVLSGIEVLVENGIAHDGGIARWIGTAQAGPIGCRSQSGF